MVITGNNNQCTLSVLELWLEDKLNKNDIGKVTNNYKNARNINQINNTKIIKNYDDSVIFKRTNIIFIDSEQIVFFLNLLSTIFR